MDSFLDLGIYVKVFSDIQRTLITALRGWLVQMETEEIFGCLSALMKTIRKPSSYYFYDCQFMSNHFLAKMLECVSMPLTRPVRGFSRPIKPSQLRGFWEDMCMESTFFPVI